MKKKSNSLVVVEFDRYILFAYIILIVIGIYMMLDINSVRNSMIYFYRQLVYALVSVVLVLFILYYVNLTKLRKLNFAFIIVTILLLGLVLWKGSSIKGAQRSLNLGIVNFQPSFLARIVLIVYLSSIIDKKYAELKKAKLKEFIQMFSVPLIITLIIYGLILKGQHLSSLIISAASLIGLFFLGGIRLRILALALGICLISGVAIIKIGADFRSDRLDIYKKYFLLYRGEVPKLSPEKEYQVKESLTALTSGKLFGVGADKGRAKHYYLPEARTDYVFTVIGEEYGFLGAILVFGLHCFLFFKSMLMAYKQQDTYLKLMAMGLSLNIVLNVLVNVGVSMSILPSTGNTLPFISYSGTAMLIDSISVGIILNISAKRKEV